MPKGLFSWFGHSPLQSGQGNFYSLYKIGTYRPSILYLTAAGLTPHSSKRKNLENLAYISQVDSSHESKGLSKVMATLVGTVVSTYAIFTSNDII